MNLKKFGEFIKVLREEKGLNQEELADILHVHRTTVVKWEKGNALPLNDTLILMSEYFGVSIDELVSGERLGKRNFSKQRDKITLAFLKTNRDNKRKIQYISALLVILTFIFLVYYFFTTYNSIHVYLLSGSNESLKVTDSLLIMSNEKVYLNIGNITNNINIKSIEINKVVLYVDDGYSTKILFTGDPSKILAEKRDSIEIFKTAKLKNEYSNLYLMVYGDGFEERIKLKVIKDFQNKGLLFNKSATNKLFRPNNYYFKINPDFIYEEESNVYYMKKDNVEIMYSIDTDNCIVIEEQNAKEIKYEYQLDFNNLNYYLYDNGILKDFAIIKASQALNDEENKIFSEFKKKYLDKYFSETKV